MFDLWSQELKRAGFKGKEEYSVGSKLLHRLVSSMYAALTTGMDDFFIKNVPKFQTDMPEGEHSVINFEIYKEFEKFMEDVANVRLCTRGGHVPTSCASVETCILQLDFYVTTCSVSLCRFATD